jgi:hypothetical protein
MRSSTLTSSADRMLLHPRPRRKTRRGSNRLWMKVQWRARRSEMTDDLALLVSGMTQPIDGTARAFLLTVGNAVRAVARREDLPTPAGAPAPRPPHPAKAQPTPPAPPAHRFERNASAAGARARCETRGAYAAKCSAV